MTRVLLVGDIHLADRAPSSCTETYTDDLFGLLEQTVELALPGPSGLDRTDAVVWAGDVFHNKQPSRVSHRLVQRAIELVTSYQCPLFIVPGNHDMANDRFDSLFETQPLGVLLQAGARLLKGWHHYGGPEDLEGFGSDLPIYGVPWLQHFTDEAVTEALKDWREQGLQKASHDGGALVIAHAPLYPPSLELPYEFYPAKDWATAMGLVGDCYYGHVHERHGPYTVNGVNFMNAGAVTRGSLHESEVTRGVNVTFWDPSRPEGLSHFSEVALKAKPASEVFRLGEVAQVKDAQAQLDEFLESIGSTSLESVSAESVLAHVKTLGLSPEVVTLVEELLAGATID